MSHKTRKNRREKKPELVDGSDRFPRVGSGSGRDDPSPPDVLWLEKNVLTRPKPSHDISTRPDSTHDNYRYEHLLIRPPGRVVTREQPWQKRDGRRYHPASIGRAPSSRSRRHACVCRAAPYVVGGSKTHPTCSTPAAIYSDEGACDVAA